MPEGVWKAVMQGWGTLGERPSGFRCVGGRRPGHLVLVGEPGQVLACLESGGAWVPALTRQNLLPKMNPEGCAVKLCFGFFLAFLFLLDWWIEAFLNVFILKRETERTVQSQ